ncbi:hypothetical protein BJ546DRAFT_696929 [Cryomyces antarcticus]|uniref:Retinol dehydrogenase 12 n=1 Tax=Cryomyces antarcticus TaxID=329879 RepID=A0ABR0LNB0_9PEZI|nr:hypothetical protein LTR39_003805 [Cryomyces antarcticus]KAK5016516.1 hypothetical protein LTR60_002362 [Cryomyces antarcticus]KAK5200905.1 hypothetical protein LTR16_004463 [Cryomyces antarcticus]
MQTIRTTLVENFGGMAQNLATGDERFSLDEVPDLSGKVAVITGGSEGIGFGCTHTLLKHNIAKIFCISLRQEIADEATKAIDEEMGAGSAKKFVWLQCDLANWPQVVETANAILEQTDRIDILINNAARGIMTHQLAPLSGIDLHMAQNHMGHVVLTSHLLPLIKKTSEAHGTVRIVNLGSNAHQNAPSDVKFESVEELNKDLGPNGQYGRSKLAAILYSRYLAKHLTAAHPKILVNATHPGIVETAQSSVHIHEPYPLMGYGMSVFLKPFKKTQFEGCVSTMYAATVCQDSGLYICPPKIVENGSEMSNDMEMAERLMKLTREVVSDKTRKQSVEKGCPFKDY